VLASLDELSGVREARVDHGGVHFLLALDPDAVAEDVVESAREVLPDGRRVPSGVEAELVESFRHGATWLRATDTRELSREEAHILAKRHGEQAARALGLDASKQRKLCAILDEETVAAFERVHAEGGGLGSKSRDEFEEAARHTVERCKPFLDESERSRLAEFLNGLLSG
jgi:hypothetical protein